MSVREEQYVGPYRLEKTLGKGQTGKCLSNKIMLSLWKDNNTMNSSSRSNLCVWTLTLIS